MSDQSPDHRPVIVAGMGSLGHAVVRDLQERGEPVVCIELNGATAGVAAALHHVPVIEGDAAQPETLLRAGVDRARRHGRYVRRRCESGNRPARPHAHRAAPA